MTRLPTSRPPPHIRTTPILSPFLSQHRPTLSLIPRRTYQHLSSTHITPASGPHLSFSSYTPHITAHCTRRTYLDSRRTRRTHIHLDSRRTHYAAACTSYRPRYHAHIDSRRIRTLHSTPAHIPHRRATLTPSTRLPRMRAVREENIFPSYPSLPIMTHND
ncbi:hypothetical protein C8R44DRAFT_889221 [Mycena epipterygia]|nr:hypothetical protein C8R44DRAFT_889221 [Mycena epipterygia]